MAMQVGLSTSGCKILGVVTERPIVVGSALGGPNRSGTRRVKAVASI